MELILLEINKIRKAATHVMCGNDKSVLFTDIQSSRGSNGASKISALWPRFSKVSIGMIIPNVLLDFGVNYMDLLQ